MLVKFIKFLVENWCLYKSAGFLLVKCSDLVIGLEIILVEFLFGIDKFLSFPF